MSRSFSDRIARLRLPLAPLLSITTGIAHPAFPPTLLHYHLLTEAALDELAHHYHQRTPELASFMYPAPVVNRWDCAADIECKRRWWGRFVGLRGCESPVEGASESRDRTQEEWDRWVRERVEESVREEKARETRMKGPL
ncbi:hypothetical protein MMC26_006817 [Xylographa opegraphella]|nr:hypothetical protein [Xylographa opegraphella]